jgi:hypothetical protein
LWPAASELIPIVHRSLIPYCAFALLVCAELAAILLLNHGFFTYSLDDPYIHLALAERISAGTYGINAGEFAAPASSILWPFLLSLFSGTSLLLYLPLILNVTAACATLYMMDRVTRDSLEVTAGRASIFWVTCLVMLLIPTTNLIGLAFTGMENSLQQLLAVLIVAGLIEESRSGRVPFYLWAAILLIPLVRHDSLALALPALAYLTWRRHRRGALWVAGVMLATLGAFSVFLELHGIGLLPTSIAAKSDLVRTNGSILSLLHGIYGNMVQSPQGTVLVLVDVLLAATALARRGAERGLAATVAAALLLHLIFGRVGAYFRYEAYLWAGTVLTLIHLHQERLREALAVGGGAWGRVAVFGALGSVSLRYVFVLASTPLAANNIYDQQYQMHRFAVDFYKGPVGVSDLGLVSFRNPSYVLDLWGLGSLEAQRERLRNPTSAWMDPLSRKHGVDMIMIYDNLFPGLPTEWIFLGQLQLQRKRITPSGDQVQFYARSPVAACKALALLTDFAATLPPGARFIPGQTRRPATSQLCVPPYCTTRPPKYFRICAFNIWISHRSCAEQSCCDQQERTPEQACQPKTLAKEHQ